MITIYKLNDSLEYDPVGRIESGAITEGGEIIERLVPEALRGDDDAILERLDGPYYVAAKSDTETTEKEWVHYEGPRGGTGWQHTGTQEVRYTEEKPSGGSTESDEGGDDASQSDAAWEEASTWNMMSDDASDVRERVASYFEEHTPIDSVRFNGTRPTNLRHMGDRFRKLNDAFDLSQIDHFGDYGELVFAAEAATRDTAGYFAADAGPWNEVQLVVRPLSYTKPRLIGVDAEDWLVTNDKYQTVVHEVAHYLHFTEFGKREDDPKLAWERYYDRLDSEEKELLEAEVSLYAATNAFEAVAEIATGLMYGKEFSDDVMALYERHGGPAVDDMGFEEVHWDEEPEAPTTLKSDEKNPWLIEAKLVEEGFRRWAGVDGTSTKAQIVDSLTEAVSKKWVPYEGPRGGEGWRNTETDEVVYQAEKPAHEGRPDDGAAAASVSTADVPDVPQGYVEAPDSIPFGWADEHLYVGQDVVVYDRHDDEYLNARVRSIRGKARVVLMEGRGEGKEVPISRRFKLSSYQDGDNLSDDDLFDAAWFAVKNASFSNIDTTTKEKFIETTTDSVLPAFKDAGMAYEVMTALSYVRNRVSRASCGGGDGKFNIKISNDADPGTTRHEFGHGIMQTYGYDYTSVSSNDVTPEQFENRPWAMAHDHNQKRNKFGLFEYDFSEDSEFLPPPDYMFQEKTAGIDAKPHEDIRDGDMVVIDGGPAGRRELDVEKVSRIDEDVAFFAYGSWYRLYNDGKVTKQGWDGYDYYGEYKGVRGEPSGLGYENFRDLIDAKVNGIEHPDLADREYEKDWDDGEVANAFAGLEAGDAIALHVGQYDHDTEETHYEIAHLAFTGSRTSHEAKPDRGIPAKTSYRFERETGEEWMWEVNDETGELITEQGSSLIGVDYSRSEEDDPSEGYFEPSRDVENPNHPLAKYPGFNTNPETVEEKVENLARACNMSWYYQAKMLEAYGGQRQGWYKAMTMLVGGNYGASNAHETMAMLHETLQSEKKTKKLGAYRIHSEHPWLYAAYTDLFEVSEMARDGIKRFSKNE